MTTRFAV